MDAHEMRSHIYEILNQEILMSLATTGDDGPWASVVEYAADAHMNLYWLSDPQSRHSQNIATTNQAACTITLPLTERGQGIGLQICGTATVLAGEAAEQARVLLEQKRTKTISPELVAKRSFYKLTPTTLYLLHEPRLGYKRVAYEMKQ